jgi:hypothetical protein
MEAKMAFDDSSKGPPTHAENGPPVQPPSEVDQQRRREIEDMLDLVRWGGDGGNNLD